MFKPGNWKKFFLALLTALLLAFIWGNSFMNAEASGAVSDGIGAWLARVFGEVSITVIRKTAHFSEFAALGFLMHWQHILWKGKSLSTPILLALLTALTDETIQLFSRGRAGMVQDVWIDFAGVLAGTAVLYLIRLLAGGKRK